jgi:hypothetical protein
MSESYRLKKVLASIQDRIRSLGNTNRNRWASMTMEQTITFEKFLDKIHFLGNNTSESDLKIIWFSLDFPNIMKYPDFLKFVSQDVEDFVVKQVPEERQTNDDNSRNEDYNRRQSARDYDDWSPRQRESIISQIRNSIRELCNLCIISDSSLSGDVPQRVFLDNCKKVGINVSDPEFQRLIMKCERSGRSLVSYFIVADEVCHSDFDEDYQSTRSDLNRRKSQNDYDEPHSRQQARKQDYDDENYQSSRSDLNQRKSQNDYDTQKKQPEEDDSKDFPDLKKVTTTNHRELSEIISQQIQDHVGNTKIAFSRWRGTNEKLSALDLRNGLARETRIFIPLKSLESLLEGFGGDLNLTNFVRLVQGQIPQVNATKSENVPQVNPNIKRSGDDSALWAIANQLNGKKWEEVILKSNTSDDMVRGFNKIGVVVGELEMRKLNSKIGKTGLIDALRSKQNIN